MFEQFISRKKPTQTAKPRRPGLYRVKTAKELLAKQERQQLLDKYKKLLTLPKEDYQPLVSEFIEGLAEFVQSLPETQNSYYSNQGGMLDHAMERSAIALSLCRAYLLPKESQDNPLTKEQALWAYAVFTASMLHDIGKVAIDLKIHITNEDGRHTQMWLPYEGSMLELNKGNHYKYEFEKVNRDELRRRVTRILTRQLMPEKGFLWIASNKDVLAVWLAILDDDDRGGGTWGPVIPLADAQVINRYFAHFPTTPTEGVIPEGVSLPPDLVQPDLEKADISEAGREFLEWLREGINTGQITVNRPDSSIHLAEGNKVLMLYPEIFKEFAARSSSYKDWHGVMREFSSLDLMHTDINKNPLQSFYQKTDPNKGTLSTKDMVEIKNSFLLLNPRKMPNVSTNVINIPASVVMSAKIALAAQAHVAPAHEGPSPSSGG